MVVVSDGELAATKRFALTVVAVDYVPVVSSFNHPLTSVGLDVAITLFEARDDTNVTGYMVTTTDTPPSYDDPAWSDVPPSAFSVPTVGTYILYPWVKDGSGNVSAPYGVVYEVNVVNNVLYVTILSGDLNGDDEPEFANRSDNALHVVTLAGGRIDGLRSWRVRRMVSIRSRSVAGH